MRRGHGKELNDVDGLVWFGCSFLTLRVPLWFSIKLYYKPYLVWSPLHPFLISMRGSLKSLGSTGSAGASFYAITLGAQWGPGTRQNAEMQTLQAHLTFDHSFFGWGTMVHLCWTAKWRHLVGLLATNPKFAPRCSSCGRASVDVLCPVLNFFSILIHAIHAIHALVKQNFGQNPFWLRWRP